MSESTFGSFLDPVLAPGGGIISPQGYPQSGPRATKTPEMKSSRTVDNPRYQKLDLTPQNKKVTAGLRIFFFRKKTRSDTGNELDL